MRIIRSDSFENDQIIGLIHYTKIVIDRSPQMLLGRLRLFQEQLYFELDGQSLHQTPYGWAQPSTLYETVKQIQREQWIAPVHSGFDITLLYALQFACPVRLVAPEQTITLAQSDVQLPFVDNISTNTTEAVQLFYFPPSWTAERCKARLQVAQQFFYRIHGGSHSITLLTKQSPTYELGGTSPCI